MEKVLRIEGEVREGEIIPTDFTIPMLLKLLWYAIVGTFKQYRLKIHAMEHMSGKTYSVTFSKKQM